MIRDLVNTKTIRLQLDAADWRDAITQAAQPMVQEGLISEGYIAGIIESAEVSGPYFVLAPHIALPHAPREKGALKTGLGIAVLKTPVAFNSQANDPVKYLFTLSATLRCTGRTC